MVDVGPHAHPLTEETVTGGIVMHGGPDEVDSCDVRCRISADSWGFFYPSLATGNPHIPAAITGCFGVAMSMYIQCTCTLYFQREGGGREGGREEGREGEMHVNSTHSYNYFLYTPSPPLPLSLSPSLPLSLSPLTAASPVSAPSHSPARPHPSGVQTLPGQFGPPPQPLLQHRLPAALRPRLLPARGDPRSAGKTSVYLIIFWGVRGIV